MVCTQDKMDKVLRCPVCGDATVEENVTESCRLATGTDTNILSVCIDAKRLCDFQQGVGSVNRTKNEEDEFDDPCRTCQNVIITHEQGTFVEVIMVTPVEGRPQFEETHKCKCGANFKLNRQTMLVQTL